MRDIHQLAAAGNTMQDCAATANRTRCPTAGARLGCARARIPRAPQRTTTSAELPRNVARSTTPVARFNPLPTVSSKKSTFSGGYRCSALHDKRLLAEYSLGQLSHLPFSPFGAEHGKWNQSGFDDDLSSFPFRIGEIFPGLRRFLRAHHFGVIGDRQGEIVSAHNRCPA